MINNGKTKARIRKAVKTSSGLISRAFVIVPFLALALALVLISYVALGSLAFMNKAKKTELEKRLSVAHDDIINLESQLSTMERNITLKKAKELGFKEVKVVKYFETKPITALLSGNEI